MPALYIKPSESPFLLLFPRPLLPPSLESAKIHTMNDHNRMASHLLEAVSWIAVRARHPSARRVAAIATLAPREPPE